MAVRSRHARALAEPWDGDRALFLRDLDTQQYGVVWTSAWEDDEAAQAVADSLWTIHGRTIDDTFEPERFALADDGEPVWIEVRGVEVTVLENVDPNLMVQLADSAFAAEPIMRVASPSLAELLHSLQ